MNDPETAGAKLTNDKRWKVVEYHVGTVAYWDVVDVETGYPVVEGLDETHARKAVDEHNAAIEQRKAGT